MWPNVKEKLPNITFIEVPSLFFLFNFDPGKLLVYTIKFCTAMEPTLSLYGQVSCLQVLVSVPVAWPL